MLNKKLGLLVMSAAMLGLVACGGNNDQKSSEQKTTQEAQTSQQQGGTSQAASQGDTPSIPEVAGKLAIYFHFVDTDNVKLAELPDFVSPFITGAWNTVYAKTVSGGAYEMIRLENTDVFYAHLPADSAMGDLGYQITLGYNSKSGLAEDKQGCDWNYKTMYSAANYIGYDHPFLTKISDTLYEAKSDDPKNPMGFKDVLPEPVVIKNITASFTLDASLKLGSNLEIVAKGDYNSWATEAVAEKDGVYTITLGDETDGIIAGDVQLCIGVRNKLVGGDMQDRYNLAIKDRKKATGGDEEAVKDDKEVVTKYQVTNIVVGLIAAYGDGHNYELGSLAAPVHASGTLENYELPSNEAPKLANSYVIRLENTGAALEGTVPCIAGAFVGWDAPHLPMTVVEEGKLWEYVIEPETIYVGVKQEFKFTDGVWNSSEVAPVDAEGKVDGNFDITPDQGDLGIKITADIGAWGGKVAGTPSKLDDILFGEEDVAALIVWNTAATAAETVTIAGDFQGWDPAATPLVYDAENGCYGYVFSLNGKKHGDKVLFKITNGTWDKALGKAGGNYELVLSYGVDFYELDADLLNFEGELTPHIAEVL